MSYHVLVYELLQIHATRSCEKELEILLNVTLAAALPNVVDASSTGMLAVEWT
jgi:hypothetical protein